MLLIILCCAEFEKKNKKNCGRKRKSVQSNPQAKPVKRQLKKIKTESRTDETVQVTEPPPHVPVHVPLSENLLYALDDSCFTEDQINSGDDRYSVGCEQQHHYVGEDDDVHITHSILSGFSGDDGAASSCLLQETDFDGGSFDFEDCDSFS
ncbi:unnamed protein product [Dovyalis caffra]|uniref:Uncharacterized protein n=1 Tax=Dovyalis caffra TaxID=77055 RepID=A0AAV1RWW2_9ROSI|nr:unnamed protein product [Dovyalis caffra]